MKFRLPFYSVLVSTCVFQYAYAADLDAPSTTFSTPINFCNVKAKEAIGELDKLSLNRVQEINKIKTEINGLNARNNLIGGFLKIRDDFRTSYAAVANQAALNEKHLDANLDQFKTLLNSSLTMSLVNIVAKSETRPLDLAKNPATITKLCSEAKNLKTNLCDYINSKPWFAGTTIASLDKTLQNVYLALDNSSNPEQIKNELQAIYSTIPAAISPDKVFQDLTKHSPNLVSALGSSKDKQAISDCLNSLNNQSCKNLMSDPNMHASLKSVLTSEMTAVHKEFTGKKFDDFFAKLNSSAPKSSEEISKLMNKKAAEASDYLKKQLANNNGKISIGFTQSDLDKFNSVCIQEPGKAFNISECEEHARKLITYLEKEKSENDTKLAAAEERLNKVINEDGSMEAILKMKQYVAQKYMRTCKDAKESDVISDMSCPCLNENETATNLPGETSHMGQLNSRISSIIARLKGQSKISKQGGELGPFSKAELEVYKNYCRNSSVIKAAVAASVCKDIYNESNKIAGVKETKEWEDFNKKYWVEYSPKNKKGYEVYEKKSTLRIIGEGLSPNVGKLYNMFMFNYSLESQIQAMTMQGQYQKQMMYMNTPGTPWMPYSNFQQFYYPTTTGTIGGGFNFAK
ncbi:MAG: hypothetical protein WC635_00370 [Bacteriovorax sp.]|jgi:hypothetical protein